jgi:integrase/recombinase XerD
MTLRVLIECYVTFKQSLGLSFRSEAQVLRAFCRMIGDRDIAEVTPSQVLAYLTGTGPTLSICALILLNCHLI